MKQLPHAIFALDGCMEIQMNARRSSLSNKFKASYTTFFRNQSLPSVFYSKCYSVQSIYITVGVISSSGWPLFYRNNAFILSDCEWDIDTLNIKKVYKLNFMDMDLYNVGIFSDDVIIKGKAANAKNEWKYSRKNQLPFSLTTQYSSLKVKFDTSPLSQDNYRGFIVGFVAYDNVQTSISVSWKVVVGVVFAIVFLFACSIFCFRKYKKVKKVKKSSDKVLYGTIPTETYDSKTQQGYPLQQTNPQQPGYPPQQLGYPPQQPGYAPQQPGYPPQQSGYPPQYSAYPPQQPVYPPQQSEYPQQSAYPPLVKQN